MPRVSRKRKAAMLRCIERKRKAIANNPEAIRASAVPVNLTVGEIMQPNGSIDDPYTDCDENSSSQSFSPEYDTGLYAIPLPLVTETPSSELLTNFTDNVAAVQLPALEELSLPDEPFIGSSEVDQFFACIEAPSFSRLTYDLKDRQKEDRPITNLDVNFLSKLPLLVPDPGPLSPILAAAPEIDIQTLSTCSAERAGQNSTTSMEVDQPIDNQCEGMLVGSIKAPLQQARIKLTRSKIRIIEIPGKPPGVHDLEHSECCCEACEKCAEFNQRTLGAESREVQGDETAEMRMRDIYNKFEKLEYSTGIYNRTDSFAETATKAPRKTSATAERYNAASADDFAQVDLPKWKPLIGRRIIDYDYFVKWIITAQAVHSRHCLGILCPQQEVVKCMTSTLWLMCNVCSVVVKGSSEEPSRGSRLRFSTSWAILNTGSTYTMAHDLFSFLNIPFMGNKAFSKDETAMDVVLEQALQESLQKAVEEEVNLALQEIKEKQLPEDTPLNLSCELDGSWGQRSNGHRYNSASGCAAMIGTRSKKVMFIGTRNKRCMACNRNTSRLKSNQRITPHKCYKNYTGSSGGMESDIIIEGFKTLYAKGIKFTTVITDGDSTTVSKLKNNCEYGHEIQHQLCCNHTIKNAGKKLREIKCPKQFADQVSCRLERITKGVRSAIKHCADTGSEDVEGLRYDIRNVPYHVFGSHSSCRDYFCAHKNESNETPGIITDLKNSGIWDKITVIMEKLASKAEFLCENRTSNLAENLFCRLCKYNVGKRIDTMSRGSYQRRVQITALMCNENYSWHDVYMETFTGEPPGFWTRKMFAEKARSLEQTRRAQKNPNYSRRSRNAPREKEMDYGEEAVEAAENAAREDVVIDIDTMRNKYQIQDSTKKKLKNCITITEMEELAKGRVLSKFVSEIINARESSKWKKCESLLQTTNTWNFLKSNRAVVGLVLRVLKEEHALAFDENKMFIDPCHEFLCCVPDAISKDGSTILLIRKKESTGDITAQALTSKGVLGCKIKNGEITLDRNTMLEIQTALHICSSTRCIVFFMLGSSVSNHLIKFVSKDEGFFEMKVEPKLNVFINDYFLKKLLEKRISIKQ